MADPASNKPFPVVNRKVIEKDRRDLLEKLAKLRKQVPPGREPGDEADLSNGSEDESMRLANILLTEKKVRAVEELLRDLANGSAFICRVCHRPLDPERIGYALTEKMYEIVTLCVECANVAEAKGKKRGIRK